MSHLCPRQREWCDAFGEESAAVALHLDFQSRRLTASEPMKGRPGHDELEICKPKPQ